MFFFVKMLFAFTFYQVKGDNIMLGKPSKQSSTVENPERESWKANDGLDSTISGTNNTDKEPYWQGDLQGYYRISNISVRISDYNSHPTRSLFVGASVMDVTCPGNDVIICGQWREDDPSFLQTFTCNFAKPVRFIRIWRVVKDHLLLHEVSVHGVVDKINISVLKYKSTMSEKVLTPNTSLTVAMVTECAITCLNTQPCIAFSFRQGGQLNCLLATGVKVTPDADWVTYSVNSCHKVVACN